MMKSLIAYVHKDSMEQLGHCIEEDMELSGLLMQKIKEGTEALSDDVEARNFFAPAKHLEQSCQEKLARSRKSLEEVELRAAKRFRRAAREDIRALFDTLSALRKAAGTYPSGQKEKHGEQDA